VAVARGLAQGECQKLPDAGKITTEEAYDIEIVAATCGLIHDLGNPPFGHAGEAVITDWFKKQSEDFWKLNTT
jgi:dGTPase